MAYPFGAPRESNGQGWFSPHRQLKKLISSLLPQAKRFTPTTEARSRPRKLQFEALEPRLLLSADLAFMADPGGSDLTVKLDTIDDIETLVIIDNDVVDPAAQIVASQALVGTSAIRITGGAGDDHLTVETSPFLVPVRFDDLSTEDNDTLALTGALGNVWQVTGVDEGQADIIGFTGIENLLGDSADDIFTVADGASVSGSIDGGTGTDTLDYSSNTGAVSIDLASISGVESILGGSGNDTLLGTVADTTWNVTGIDSGDVDGISFSSFENLSGRADNEDTFVIAAAGQLSGLVDGGSGGFDSMALSGGSFTSVEYIATGAQSGYVVRDGSTLAYDGLEPIFDNSDAADLVITIGGPVSTLIATDDIASLTDNGTTLTLASDSTIPTFESVTFNNPTNSLTINLSGDLGLPFLSKDVLTINSFDVAGIDLSINGEAGIDEVIVTGDITARDLEINAEKITISSMLDVRNLTLTSQAEDDGAVDLGGVIALQGFYIAVPEAVIDLSGASIMATENVTLTATATANVVPDPLSLAGALDATVINVTPEEAYYSMARR